MSYEISLEVAFVSNQWADNPVTVKVDPEILPIVDKMREVIKLFPVSDVVGYRPRGFVLWLIPSRLIEAVLESEEDEEPLIGEVDIVYLRVDERGVWSIKGYLDNDGNDYFDTENYGVEVLNGNYS